MQEFKVLMVDDEEDFVTTLAERVKMRDLHSEVALNGEQALERMQEDVPDVMVLDLKMPGIDGMEVLKRVRQAYPEVQVIVLTGHGTDKDEDEALRLGAYAYLQKPVAIEKLVKTMKDAYKNKVEASMVAATFAQAGDFDTARQIMADEDKKK
ncbi:response regulator [Thermodesulfobacteriota bacterium]